MYSQEIKQMVLKRIKNGEKVKSINANTGISIATIYRWVKEEKLESNNIATPFDELSDVELLQKYCNINDLDNALNICLDPKNKNNPIIQSQHVKILIMKSGLYDALAICEQPLFLTDNVIQSQRISILVMQNRICEALAICENPIFEKNDSIQTQHIKILIKKGKIDEALKMCEQPVFFNDKLIQSQRIGILIKQGKLIEALSICERPEFVNYSFIQSQRIKILIDKGDYENALMICDNPFLSWDSVINKQRDTIMSLLQSSLDKPSEESNYTESPKGSLELAAVDTNVLFEKNLDLKIMNIEYSFLLLEAIKKDEILSSDEIDKCEISDIEKVILTTALYDKQNMPLNIVLKFLKQKMEEHKLIKKYLKVIQLLLIKTKSKRRIFDIMFYRDLLYSFEETKSNVKPSNNLLYRCKPN